MEKHSLISFPNICGITILLWLAACNNPVPNGNANPAFDSTKPDTNIGKVISLNNGMHCFAYTRNNDSVFLSLLLKDSLATGKLQYRLYGKDANAGTIKGIFHGDTLVASYSFLSEGVRSQREVAFLRKGNILQEGTGNMKDNGHGLVFVNRRQISFNGNIILELIPCVASVKKK